jgi:hypothetical protein
VGVGSAVVAVGRLSGPVLGLEVGGIKIEDGLGTAEVGGGFLVIVVFGDARAVD